MMKNYIKHFAIVVVTAAVAIGGTAAYFNDVETSTSNYFQAGEIDLKIDNDSYYNGLKCALDDSVYKWQGSIRPEYDTFMTQLIGQPCSNSWEANELEDKLFFDFEDVKPGDWGEDTISLQLNGNDSWACLTLNTDPVSDGTPPENIALREQIDFIWWADDSDNVLETDEMDNIVIAQGAAVDSLNGTYALSDSARNAWTNTAGDPLDGDDTVYLAKAWCFGEMTLEAQAPGSGDPQVHPGFECSPGAAADNSAQHGRFGVDVRFEAVQARNLADFVCVQP